jgi:hypothetical protein
MSRKKEIYYYRVDILFLSQIDLFNGAELERVELLEGGVLELQGLVVVDDSLAE